MEQQIGIRVTDIVLARLDSAVERSRQDSPGLNVTRSDLVRQFLLDGLQRYEAAARKRGGFDASGTEETAQVA